MVDVQQVQDLLSNGGTVTGLRAAHTGRIGKIVAIFLDERTKEPEWATVRTGILGGAESFVPLQDACVSGTTLHVPFTRHEVREAARVVRPRGHLSRGEEFELYRHYGMPDPKARLGFS